MKRVILIIFMLCFCMVKLSAASDTAYIELADVNKKIIELEKLKTDKETEINNLSDNLEKEEELNFIQRILKRKKLEKLHKAIEEKENISTELDNLIDARMKIYLKYKTKKYDKKLEVLSGRLLSLNNNEIEKARKNLKNVKNADDKIKKEKKVLDLMTEHKKINELYYELIEKYGGK